MKSQLLFSFRNASIGSRIAVSLYSREDFARAAATSPTSAGSSKGLKGASTGAGDIEDEDEDESCADARADDECELVRSDDTDG